MVYVAAGDSLSTFTAQLGGFIATIFWVSLGVVILVRVINAVRRRKARSIRRDVLQPFASSAAVLSKAYGWKPLDSQSVLIMKQEGGSIYSSVTDDDGTSGLRREKGKSMDAHSWDERYRSARSGQMNSGLWSTQPHGRLQSIVDPLTPGTALDLASGDGRNAIWLAHRGWEVTALDFSAEGLDIARARAEADGVSIDWQLGDATDWEPARNFDLITITYLHLDESANIQVIQRASQWLAPGGTLLVIGHDKENLSRGTGGPQDEGILYSPEMLRDAAAGLTILVAEQIVRNTSTDPEGPADAGPQAVDTLLHAVND